VCCFEAERSIQEFGASLTMCHVKQAGRYRHHAQCLFFVLLPMIGRLHLGGWYSKNLFYLTTETTNGIGVVDPAPLGGVMSLAGDPDARGPTVRSGYGAHRAGAGAGASHHRYVSRRARRRLAMACARRWLAAASALARPRRVRREDNDMRGGSR